MAKVNVDKMLLELRTQNQQWFQNLDTQLQKQAVEETAKDTVKLLKQISPKDTGDYARTWKYDRKMHFTGMYRYAMTVYNDKNYRLTHLLEHGHAKVNGGRTKAQPHIAKAEDVAEEVLYDKVLDLISKSI